MCFFFFFLSKGLLIVHASILSHKIGGKKKKGVRGDPFFSFRSQLAALDYWLVYATRSCQVVIFDIKRISEELFDCVRAPVSLSFSTFPCFSFSFLKNEGAKRKDATRFLLMAVQLFADGDLKTAENKWLCIVSNLNCLLPFVCVWVCPRSCIDIEYLQCNKKKNNKISYKSVMAHPLPIELLGLMERFLKDSQECRHILIILYFFSFTSFFFFFLSYQILLQDV